MYKCNVGPLTGALKPKYNYISTKFGESIHEIKDVDVFIDLSTLLSSMAGYKKFMQALPFSENVDIDILSSTLMIAKHWRDFCKNKFNNFRIIMFANDPCVEPVNEKAVLSSYLMSYKAKFEKDNFKQLVYYWNKAMKALQGIVNYIPGVYFINVKTFDSYVLPNMLEDYDKENKHRIIVSGSLIYSNYVYKKNTKVFYARLTRNGITHLDNACEIAHSATSVDDTTINDFIHNKVFYALIQAIIGDVDRGFLGVTTIGLNRFATNLLRAIEKRDIPQDPESIETVLPIIDKTVQDYIRKVYPLIELDKHCSLIKKSVIEKIKTEMVDIYDDDKLGSISIDGLNLLELRM